MAEAHAFLAYGLVLSLPARMRALRVAPPDVSIDVSVTYGDVPTELIDVVGSEDLSDYGLHREIDRDGRVLWTTQSARYLVEGGARIVVDRNGEVRGGLRFVLALALPALLMQRGMLVLHATTVADDYGALCIAGESGAGKSTLAAALLRRGLRLVSDDASVFGINDAGAVQALPGHCQYSLHEATQNMMDAPTMWVRHIPGPREKVALWAPPEACVEEPRLLAATIILRHGAPGSSVSMIPLAGLPKAQAVLGQAYLPTLLTLRPEAYPALPRLLADVPLSEVNRPEDSWTVDELADRALALLDRHRP